jgi:hypothetical protein
MATLEKRGRHFRIVFSYGNRKFSRSLKTASEGAAQATLARVEDNLHRLSLGTIALPEGADLATFLLTDGRSQQQPVPAQAAAPSLSLTALFDAYFSKLPEGSLEEVTIVGMKTYRGTSRSGRRTKDCGGARSLLARSRRRS